MTLTESWTFGSPASMLKYAQGESPEEMREIGRMNISRNNGQKLSKLEEKVTSIQPRSSMNFKQDKIKEIQT